MKMCWVEMSDPNSTDIRDILDAFASALPPPIPMENVTARATRIAQQFASTMMEAIRLDMIVQKIPYDEQYLCKCCDQYNHPVRDPLDNIVFNIMDRAVSLISVPFMESIQWTPESKFDKNVLDPLSNATRNVIIRTLQPLIDQKFAAKPGLLPMVTESFNRLLGCANFLMPPEDIPRHVNPKSYEDLCTRAIALIREEEQADASASTAAANTAASTNASNAPP